MLKIEHLTKHYPGSTKGITDLSLHIQKGDLYAFIGQNGAGKTTTLKSVSGIYQFDSGRILIDGIDIEKDPVRCKQIMAYIPDNPDLYEYLTGFQYVNFIADIYKISSEKRQEQIQKYGDLFGITDVLGNLISSYSHGMKQKLAILSALVHTPKLLILDEPFVGLDPKAVFTMKMIMKELCSQGGAVFFSTHVLEVAEKLCNKVAIVKDGHLISSGTMKEITKGNCNLESVFMEVAVNDKTIKTDH